MPTTTNMSTTEQGHKTRKYLLEGALGRALRLPDHSPFSTATRFALSSFSSELVTHSAELCAKT